MEFVSWSLPWLLVTPYCCARRCVGLLLMALITPCTAGPRRPRVMLDLRDNVATVTKHRYAQAYQAVQNWLWDNGFPPMGWLVSQSTAMVNEVLMMYIQYLYDEKRAYTHAPYTLAAIQHFHRSLHGQLRPAWQSVKTWRHAEPGELRAPIPLGVLWGLMAVALATRSSGMAALLALAYHCLLRPGELCRLTRRHLRLPGDSGWHAAVGMVVVTDPKTAKIAARVQHVVIHDKVVLALCRSSWGALPPGARLGPTNTHELEKWFRWALKLLLLRENQFTPAGLRAGGATHDYLAGSPVERLMWRGRWAALTTLKHYVQECTSVLATASMPVATQHRLANLEAMLVPYLDALTGSWQ